MEQLVTRDERIFDKGSEQIFEYIEKKKERRNEASLNEYLYKLKSLKSSQTNIPIYLWTKFEQIFNFIQGSQEFFLKIST